MQSLSSSDTAAGGHPDVRTDHFQGLPSGFTRGTLIQDLTSFSFSPFGSTAAHLLNLGFDSGKKI